MAEVVMAETLNDEKDESFLRHWNQYGRNEILMKPSQLEALQQGKALLAWVGAGEEYLVLIRLSGESER